jgi:hypothetical protein
MDGRVRFSWDFEGVGFGGELADGGVLVIGDRESEILKMVRSEADSV